MDGWLGVELRHLITLTAVQEERSFRGAAKRLGYVQSAVSQQIADLEELVDARLVERTRGHAGVDLTESGRVLLRHAERILSQLGAAQADLRSLEKGNRLGVRLGLHQSLAARLLPHTLTRLDEHAPGVQLRASEELSESELFRLVEEGELDIAVAELPLESGPFESKTLFVDPLVLLVPADSPLVGAERLELADIAAKPLIADPAWRMFDLIAAEFGLAGLDLEARFSARTNAGVQALVAAGLGVAVMPSLAGDPGHPLTVPISLDHLLPRQRIVAFWHRDRDFNSAFEILVEVMGGVGQEIAASRGLPALGDTAPS
jgi:DNA-binding transcriptional LysR family regulator